MGVTWLKSNPENADAGRRVGVTCPSTTHIYESINTLSTVL